MLVGHLLAGLALAATQAIPTQQLTLELRYDEDDRFPLTRVASMALGESGVLYVADALELSVAILDSTGRVAGTIGREGRGPGEFASIGAIGVFGDTVWAVDPALRRLLLFDTSGTTRVTISGQRTDTAMWPAFPIETPPETVLRGAHVTLAASTSSPQQRNLTLLGVDGRPVLAFATVDLARMRLFLRGSRGLAVSTYQPLDDSPLWASSPDGSRLVVVEREAANSEAGSMSVSARTVSGDLVFRTSCGYEPELVPASVMNDIVERAARANPGISGGAMGAAEDAARQSLYLPTYYTPVDAVVVAKDNRVWLREHGADHDATAVWLVLDPSGVPAARILGPALLTVRAADGNRAWGTEQDAFGTLHAVRYGVGSGDSVRAATSPWRCSTAP